ncbi:MAG: immunoglobulin-like domain-containing protein [Eubacteriales bacterium]
MKILRTATVILFAITLCVFAWFFFDTRLHSDATYPSIQVDSPVLEISIRDGEEKLLEGVTAYDAKDGDLTSKVIVESISQFTDKGICTVTYAVADADKHVAKNTRKICYTDYTSPKFTMNQALVFPVGTNLDIHSIIGATDSIDGDISEKVIIAATDFQTNSTGVFSLSLQATNSKGDVIYLDLPIYVEESNLRAPVIELKEYLIYIPKGEIPDFPSYISSVTSNYSSLDEGGVLISENFNAQLPGVYSVHYYAQDNLGNEGHTVLTVVVEE